MGVVVGVAFITKIPGSSPDMSVRMWWRIGRHTLARGCEHLIPQYPTPLCCPLVWVFHDESTFYANADQTSFWTNGTRQVLKQKSLGQSLMVSDCIE
jgi:hypothetical protein